MSGKTTVWTPERIEQARAVLAETGNMAGAAVRLGVSEPSLRSMFHDKGIEAPTDPKAFAVAPAQPIVWPPEGYEPAIARPAKTAKAGKVLTSIKAADFHCPYHDRRSVDCATAIIREVQPDELDLLGDVMEAEALSRHPKSRPDIAKWGVECYETNLLLDRIENACPNAKKRYFQGNHEGRADRYEAEWGQLDGVLSVPKSLFLEPRGDYRRETSQLRGIEWIPLKMQPFTVRNTAMLHGVFESQYHAYMTAMHLGPRVRVRYLYSAHMHGFQSFVSPAGHTAFALPWLGDETAHTIRAYVKGKPKPWNKGLLIVEECGATVTTTPVFIENGRALFAGRIVQAAA